jgi:hypothetical protein
MEVQKRGRGMKGGWGMRWLMKGGKEGRDAGERERGERNIKAVLPTVSVRAGGRTILEI